MDNILNTINSTQTPEKMDADYESVLQSSGLADILQSPYPEVPGLPNAYQLFYLGNGGLAAERRMQTIAAITKRFETARNDAASLGTVDAAADIMNSVTFLKLMNGYYSGDAFKEDNSSGSIKGVERAVLDYYAQLWNAEWPHSKTAPDSYWGFCLDAGSIDGIIYGMWNARDYLSGKRFVVGESTTIQGGAAVKTPRLVRQKPVVDPSQSENAYTPILFHLEADARFTLTKAINILDLVMFSVEGQEKYPGQCPITDDGEWPAEVPSNDSGAMDIDSLAKLVEFFASKGYPIFVVFNYGTADIGAYDDVAGASEKLKPTLEKYGLWEREVKYDDKVEKRTGYWFHVEGSPAAVHMRYLEMAHDAGKISEKVPVADFRLPMVISMAMRGGNSLPGGVYLNRTKAQMLPPDMPEYIGGPDSGLPVKATSGGDDGSILSAISTGVILDRTKHQMLPDSMPEYIGNVDDAFTVARNMLASVLQWDQIASSPMEDQILKSVQLEALATYVESRLLYLQNKVLQTDLYVKRVPLALSVQFKRANDELCKKYLLQNRYLAGRHYSFVSVTEQLTTELVDALIKDLSQEGAFAT